MKIVEPDIQKVGIITAAMMERRALPIGRTQFNEWADRIIQGAMVEADDMSLRFTLCGLLMQLGHTESFKEDAYFIHALRKAAVNETAHAIMSELKAEQQKKRAETEVSHLKGVDGPVLDHKEV